MSGMGVIRPKQDIAVYAEFLQAVAQGDRKAVDIARANPDLFTMSSELMGDVETGSIEVTCPWLFTEALVRHGTEAQRAILN